MEPLLRYAGNKRRIADVIISHIRECGIGDGGRYLELFAGGAAVFFKLEPAKSVLVDICKPIISFYEAIQREPDAVNEEILKISMLPHNPDVYYQIRSEWSYHDFGPRFAARLLYLNKTGYNGLWRLNSKLEYNVPWGKKKTAPKYPSPEIINRASDLLRGCTLYASDYLKVLNRTHKGDVVYTDPPYYNMYSGYSGQGFTNENHQELADAQRNALMRGVSIVHSNIDCDGVRGLYRDWSHINTVPVQHTVAAATRNRRTVNEVIVVAKAPYEDPRQTRLCD